MVFSMVARGIALLLWTCSRRRQTKSCCSTPYTCCTSYVNHIFVNTIVVVNFEKYVVAMKGWPCSQHVTYHTSPLNQHRRIIIMHWYPDYERGRTAGVEEQFCTKYKIFQHNLKWKISKANDKLRFLSQIRLQDLMSGNCLESRW